MNMKNKTIITIRTLINADIETVWKNWTAPAAIMEWNHASNDWHTTRAENDLRPGGRFESRMEAKDGSFGFDFGGVYDTVRLNEFIEYTLGDDRKVTVTFARLDAGTLVTESFEAENTNSIELQETGWQAILNNFKKYTESQK
jgi:uncharacterized protein YndB with AHSA1/START domain